MARFPTENPAAEPELSRLYAAVREMGMSRVPDWFTSQSLRPDLMVGTLAAAQAFIFQGQLPGALRQMIILSVSIQNGCRYCSAGHRAQAAALGVPADVLDSIAGLSLAKVTPSQRAVLELALLASRAPQSVEDVHIEKLRDLGFGDEEIVEVVMTVAFTHFLNIWAEVSDVPLDPEWG